MFGGCRVRVDSTLDEDAQCSVPWNTEREEEEVGWDIEMLHSGPK